MGLLGASAHTDCATHLTAEERVTLAKFLSPEMLVKFKQEVQARLLAASLHAWE